MEPADPREGSTTQASFLSDCLPVRAAVATRDSWPSVIHVKDLAPGRIARAGPPARAMVAMHADGDDTMVAYISFFALFWSANAIAKAGGNESGPVGGSVSAEARIRGVEF